MSSAPPTSRKEIILARAEQHFADHGFQGASLSAIARECEVGNPGLLHHFPSKELLYRAVLEKQAEELMARMRKRVDTSASLQARLQAYVALQVEWMQARPTGFRLVTRELLDNAERIQQAQIRPLESFLQGSLALLEEAQAAGLIRREIPSVVVLTIILGTLNYAKIVRPTFAKAFAEPALKSDKAWMKVMARDVLRVVSPGDASPP
ncbi:TetR family transcriptional regulator [Variovorax sp. 54]|uniref:TetR/AcrR family transcriptional regulator n=1 Tax=Variovorax sp. 54 TaxID=2035212 RepID=UPI000C177B4F|nr:TetR/AcrR family transcriptional regulator [Variovorax sp. 54]PIF74786.1 TetR family transcriptional regulator [Variovorax sp. 54]